MAIQIRRGNIQDFDSSKLLPGEWAVSLDNKKVFIAFAPGDTKQMATYEDMVTDIQDATQEIIDNLTAGVDEAINNTNVAIETINQTNSDIQAAEEVREQQEQERQTNTETAIQNTNEATDRAIAAAEAAEGIVAGTGMVLKTDVGIPGGVAAFDDVYGKTEIDDKFTDVQGEIEGINQQMNISETTLSQDYKSIFNAGTGKDNTGAEQDFNSIVEGQSNVKLEGFTANNLIVNGDFSNGTNNVATINVENISASNNTLTFSAKSKNASIGFLQKVIINHKYYMRADIKTNSSLVGLMLSGFKNKFHSGSGKYEVVSDIIDVNENYDSRVAVRDTRDSGYDNINVRNVALFDLTQLGLDSLTKEQCDVMFDHYINGIQGVGSGKIVSRGKNIVNNIDWEQGALTSDTGANVASDFRLRIKGYIRVKPNTQYVATLINNSGTPHNLTFRGYDINQNFTEYIVSKSFTTGKSTNYLRVQLYNDDTTKINTSILDMMQIQLEEGSEATPYEPYKSSELITVLPTGMQLHRLPNGIADTIEEVNGTRCLIKRVRGTIYNGSESGWVFGGINGAFCTFNKTFVEKDGVCFSNTLPYHETAGDWERIVILNNVMYIKILNSRLNTQDLNGFKAWLQANPTTVIYETKTPTIQKSGEGGFSQVGNLEVYPNGTIYQEHIKPKESTNAKTYINYNLSTKALIMSNSGEITGIQKFLVGKTLIESGINVNGNYIKFDDGTMICHGTKSFTIASTAQQGSLWYDMSTTFTYPATFKQNPVFLLQCSRSEFVGSSYVDFTPNYNKPKTLFVSQVSSFSGTYYWMAIGKWI